ncbi:MAG TPA: hypothetical protein P5317_11010 [Myxococcota bacterium]|jgi:hypothetical protein|nr:hypothetical protein [Myxococcota bacterium]
MAWYNFWKHQPNKGKVVSAPVVQPTEAKIKPELSVFDYPKSQYKVYWETHLTHAHGAWHAEIRFIGYSDNPHMSIDRVEAPSKNQVEQLVVKLVKEKMANYKR